MDTVSRIKCAHCKGYHPTIDALKIAHGFMQAPTQVATVAQSRLPGRVGQSGYITERQYNHLKDNLGADPNVIIWFTMKYASGVIDRMQKEKKRVSQPQVQLKVPLQMLQDVPNGYYAARQSDLDDWQFFRFSRPKDTAKTRFAGALKIQTQHGPRLEEALVIWPSGKITLYNSTIQDNLLVVVVDPNGCGINYAEVLGNCMRCNTDLTDPRSRWFGIGPECEKYWPHIIDIVTDRKGPFVHGS